MEERKNLGLRRIIAGGGQDLSQILLELDSKSRAIVEYLISKRHASLHELSCAAGLRSHMEALRRIRNIINPLACRMLGRDLLSLRRASVDPVTGNMVTYHWWLEGSPGSAVETMESDKEIVISVFVPEHVSLSGEAEAWVSERSAIVRVFKGGFSDGHKD